MATSVVCLASSLVREYLSRKGLKSTLQTLDQEMPRTEQSISNRAQLAKEMHIERLMKKNKEQQEPYRSMLEVIVKYMKERASQSTQSTGEEGTTQQLKLSSEIKKDLRSRTTTQPARDNNILTQMSKPETADYRKDYDELLQRLEKDSKAVTTKKDTADKDSRTRGKREKSHNATVGSIDSSLDFIGSLSTSGNDGITKAKSQRKGHRTLGGPVISSGLAGKRDVRSHHGASRLSNSVGSLIMDKVDSEIASDNIDMEPTGPLHGIPLNGIVTEKPQKTEFSPKQSRRSSPHKSSRSQAVSSKSQKVRTNDLVFEDVDEDLDDELGQLSLGPKKIAQVDLENKPITLETAMIMAIGSRQRKVKSKLAKLFQPRSTCFNLQQVVSTLVKLGQSLKNLIFGNATSSFTPEWRNQSFSFCDLYGLEYGIVQLKGGPCGVLAAVQAFVLKHLLFGDKKGDSKKKLQPSPKERTKALTSGICEILWRAGDTNSAIVALPGTGGSNFFGAGRYKPDQLTEALVLYRFKSSESLCSFISQNITQFESDRSCGCILLLYSVILSRSIERVISDMDEPSNRLMGAHGYCTQEMVNLFLTGRAASNTFDNILEIDTGGVKKNVFKGVEKQSDIGLLSLFEHYKSCEVGVNLKTPRYPIWVICSESHFSVLFSVDRNLLNDWKSEKFDLFYFDGLARQDDEIRLTIDTTRECPMFNDGDLVPPLELCIRTRWKNAVVDWNGSEAIL